MRKQINYCDNLTDMQFAKMVEDGKNPVSNSSSSNSRRFRLTLLVCLCLVAVQGW